MRLNGHEFMRRFLQHVLPKGLHKVRYSGLWHPSRREHAAHARDMLGARSHYKLRAEHYAPYPLCQASLHPLHRGASEVRLCPCCNACHLQHVRKLYPRQVRVP